MCFDAATHQMSERMNKNTQTYNSAVVNKHARWTQFVHWERTYKVNKLRLYGLYESIGCQATETKKMNSRKKARSYVLREEFNRMTEERKNPWRMYFIYVDEFEFSLSGTPIHLNWAIFFAMEQKMEQCLERNLDAMSQSVKSVPIDSAHVIPIM